LSLIKNKTLIIGHRGAYNEATENSLEGFKKAIELGADYIEFDVHKTLDKKFSFLGTIGPQFTLDSVF
jgi:glycerophosphoryl diester phosphodiesterase